MYQKKKKDKAKKRYLNVIMVDEFRRVQNYQINKNIYSKINHFSKVLNKLKIRYQSPKSSGPKVSHHSNLVPS